MPTSKHARKGKKRPRQKNIPGRGVKGAQGFVRDEPDLSRMMSALAESVFSSGLPQMTQPLPETAPDGEETADGEMRAAAKSNIRLIKEHVDEDSLEQCGAQGHQKMAMRLILGEGDAEHCPVCDRTPAMERAKRETKTGPAWVAYEASPDGAEDVELVHRLVADSDERGHRITIRWVTATQKLNEI